MATERTNDVSTSTHGLAKHVKRGRLSNYGPTCSATLRMYITGCAILTQITISVLRKERSGETPSDPAVQRPAMLGCFQVRRAPRNDDVRRHKETRQSGGRA